MSFPHNWITAMTDRPISGFQCLAAVPLWTAEIVPPGHRGMLSDISAMFITLGSVISLFS